MPTSGEGRVVWGIGAANFGRRNLSIQNTVEVEQFFIMQVSCKGVPDLTVQRTLEKAVRRHGGSIYTGDETEYQWTFDSEKAAKAAKKRVLASRLLLERDEPYAGPIITLCKATRLWAVVAIDD
jgi:hypothetical protein